MPLRNKDQDYNNIQDELLKVKKLNTKKIQWPNEQMNKWTEQNIFKERSLNG
jgi:hypothetical protein